MLITRNQCLSVSSVAAISHRLSSVVPPPANTLREVLFGFSFALVTTRTSWCPVSVPSCSLTSTPGRFSHILDFSPCFHGGCGDFKHSVLMSVNEKYSLDFG